MSDALLMLLGGAVVLVAYPPLRLLYLRRAARREDVRLAAEYDRARGYDRPRETRPLRSRVWFYRPTWYWYGWKSLRPIWFAGDEFNWHTLVIGWNPTGQLVLATRPCRGQGRCAEELADPDVKPEWVLASEWPVDMNGHNHVECHTPDCYCARP